MTKNSRYEINHFQAKVILTKQFAKAASILNTPEYMTLLELRRNHPDYTFELREIRKKEGKKSYENEQSLTTLMIQLARFGAAYEIRANNAIDSPDKLNVAKKMAAVILTVLPLLVMYAVVQRWFVRSIDNSGLTGE